MKTPAVLAPLQEEGLFDEVLYQLKSGKEATVYVVRKGDQTLCAKVYKDLTRRSFRQATQYREGRKTRNSRDARAMEKGSKFGKHAQEESWRNAEVEALFTLARVGVRVPQPHGCYDGVMLMDMVCDDEGGPAPRLDELVFSREEALEIHQELLQEVIKMLCAGLIHGDLSEFNILMDPYGPVIIDLPQAVNASANAHAETLLLRDVENLSRFFGQFAPELLDSRYGQEIWQAYENGELTPDFLLTGEAEEDIHQADLVSVLREIEAARREEEMRQQRLRGETDDSPNDPGYF